MTTALRTSATLLVAALALAACTTSNEIDDVPTTSRSTQAESPEQQITAALTELATSSDPSQCTDLYTAQGLEVAIGSSDLQACRDAVVASEPADDAVVDQIVVGGDTATARVVSVGGASAGLAQTLELVREDDRWRVDGVAGLAVADRAAVDAEVSRGLLEWGPQFLPPADLPCIDDQLRAVSDADLVAAYQGGESQQPVVEAISACLGAGVDAVALYQMAQYQLVTKGLTEDQADCVAVEALGTFLDLTLEQLVTSRAARQHLSDGLLRASQTDVCQQTKGDR